MRYSTLFAPVLLTASLIASASQAAPVLDKFRVISPAPVVVPELPAPVTNVLERLTGDEFSSIQLALPDVALDRGSKNRPGKPRFQVPEPNGLFLLSLGVIGMGVLRLRTKNQTL